MSGNEPMKNARQPLTDAEDYADDASLILKIITTSLGRCDDDTSDDRRADIHFAVIEHREGYKACAAPSRRKLDADIAAYCRCCWERVSDTSDIAGIGDQAVISAYFSLQADERLTISQAAIRIAQTPTDATDDRSLEIGRYCVLGTAHLTAGTASLLDEWASWPPHDRPISIAAAVYGWFVPTRPLDGNAHDQLPPDLLAAIAFGRARGFDYILFDCDAGIVDDLAIHDW